MTSPIRVVQYGLGPIGLASVGVILDKQATGHLQLVGAIDIDPNKAGQDLAALLGRDEPTGVVVSSDAAGLLADVQPDVVVHTTSSFLDRIQDQLVLCAEANAHVVSSTEELSFPYDRHPDLAAMLDQVAKKHGVVFLGTGVNPGYAMDTLALTATGVSTDVTNVRIERVVDAGQRREPLQRKVGAGLAIDAFDEKKKTGTFGHIGLRESLLMVADGLGWSLDRIEETLDPVIALEAIKTPYLSVNVGEAAGIHHRIVGYQGDTLLLTLDLKMYVGARDPHDAVYVEGTPPIDLVVRGGIFGDTATVGALVNAIPLVMKAPPGLSTTKDLPVPRAFATSPSAATVLRSSS